MKSQLQRIVERITSFFESLGRARAAAELARLGHYKAANQLITGKPIV